jgi:hypothetical protein
LFGGPETEVHASQCMHLHVAHLVDLGQAAGLEDALSWFWVGRMHILFRG